MGFGSNKQIGVRKNANEVHNYCTADFNNWNNYKFFYHDLCLCFPYSIHSPSTMNSLVS